MEKDDAKPLAQATEGPPKQEEGNSSITGSVGDLLNSTAIVIAETVKGAANSIVQLAITSPVISGRIETAHPPVEENFDAPPMTAEELADHVAAETQPQVLTQKTKRKKSSTSKTARLTKSSKKSVLKNASKKSGKKSRKAPSKKLPKQSPRKSSGKVTGKASSAMPKKKSKKKAKKSKQ